MEIVLTRDSDELAGQLWHALTGVNSPMRCAFVDYAAVIEVLNALVGPQRYLISPMGDRVRIEILIDP